MQISRRWPKASGIIKRHRDLPVRARGKSGASSMRGISIDAARRSRLRRVIAVLKGLIVKLSILMRCAVDRQCHHPSREVKSRSEKESRGEIPSSLEKREEKAMTGNRRRSSAAGGDDGSGRCRGEEIAMYRRHLKEVTIFIVLCSCELNVQTFYLKRS